MMISSFNIQFNMENIDLQKINGFYFPANAYIKMSDNWNLEPSKILNHVEEKNICIQAGGNVGYITSVYADVFETVYTFEPIYENFFCLTKNLHQENVIKLQACLGNENKLVDLALPKQKNIERPNFGTFCVTGAGLIPTLTIDQFNLPDCNLIHLDIEGYEYYAILGAINTIKKFSPVVVLEINRSLKNFNLTKNDIFTLMENINYQDVDKINENTVFKKIR